MKQTRKTSTKQDIREALTQLLLTEPFESISVSKLCRKAGINRGTFYLHYLDKFDMMEQLKNDIISDLHQLYTPQLSEKEAIQTLFHYLKENDSFIYAISQSISIDFNQSIKDFVLQILQDSPDYEKKLQDIYQIPLPYAQEVFLSCAVSLVNTWIVTGGKESPQEITNIFLTVSQFEKLK